MRRRAHGRVRTTLKGTPFKKQERSDLQFHQEEMNAESRRTQRKTRRRPIAMKRETVEVVICRSDAGSPLLNLSDNARLVLRVDDGGDGTMRQVDLSGNAEALRALGEYLIGL